MKNLKIITCLCVSSMLAAISLSANAQTVDNTFTYQGYLEFQGQAAEGLFDFAISLLDEDAPPAGGAGGNIVDQVLLDDQSVDRGVFTLELDFQDGLFDGTNYWLHVAVREADQPTYTNFGERQKLNAVPYASWVAGGGGAGDLFESNSNGIGYTGGRFEVGGPPTNGNSLFQVDAVPGVSPLRIRIEGATRMMVHPNGGTSLGANDSSVPDNGLLVRGDSELQGDLKQEVDNSGVIKAGVNLFCSNSPSITHFFNGVNNDAITAPVGNDPGRCRIEFPFVLDNRYFMAMYLSDSTATSERRLVRCAQEAPGSSSLDCAVTNSSGTAVNSQINVMVF